MLLFTANFSGVMYRWFDSGEDDGRIEREIDVAHYVQTPPPPPCDRSVLVLNV